MSTRLPFLESLRDSIKKIEGDNLVFYATGALGNNPDICATVVIRKIESGCEAPGVDSLKRHSE